MKKHAQGFMQQRGRRYMETGGDRLGWSSGALFSRPTTTTTSPSHLVS